MSSSPEEESEASRLLYDPQLALQADGEAARSRSESSLAHSGLNLWPPSSENELSH